MTLYPVVKRQSETAALGFVTARVLEAAMIFVGILSLLSVLTLRQDLAGASGADAASLATTGQSLVAVHDWTFLLGPGIIPGVNALFLGYILYRSRLVPRMLPTLGLIGAPILFASATATVFGLYAGLVLGHDRRPPPRGVGVLARRLAGLQGLQALTNHGRSRRPGIGPAR